MENEAEVGWSDRDIFIFGYYLFGWLKILLQIVSIKSFASTNCNKNFPFSKLLSCLHSHLVVQHI